MENSITITVSGQKNVEWIRDKVRNGQFASESEVVAEGISVLRQEEAELEVWLKDVVAARYDNHKANPSSAIPIEEVQRNLEAHRNARAERSQ